MEHDHCYDAAVDQRICFDTAQQYVDPYSWRCTDGHTPVCNGKFSIKFLYIDECPNSNSSYINGPPRSIFCRHLLLVVDA